MKAKICWDPAISAYRLQMPYEKFKTEKIVEFLKTNIPYDFRQWDPNTKIWTFTEPYFDGVLKFCNIIYTASEVATVTRQQVEQAQQGRSSSNLTKGGTTGLDADLSAFMRLIPFDAAQKAYRAAALAFHPDRNPQGTMENMSKLNMLWTRIEKELYKQ
jgi:hypothetical protein